MPRAKISYIYPRANFLEWFARFSFTHFFSFSFLQDNKINEVEEGTFNNLDSVKEMYVWCTFYSFVVVTFAFL